MKEFPKEEIERVLAQKYPLDYSHAHWAIHGLFIIFLYLGLVELSVNYNFSSFLNIFWDKEVIDFTSVNGRVVFLLVNIFGLLALGEALIEFVTEKFAPQKYKDFVISWQYKYYKTKIDTSSGIRFCLYFAVFIYALTVIILSILTVLKYV